MFDQLLNIVKNQFQSNPEVVNTIPQQQQEGVQQELTRSIIDGLKSRLTGGGIGDLAAMFGGNSSGSSQQLSSSLSGSLLNNLTSKFGLPEGAAGAIAGSLLPGILNKFVSKTNDPNDPAITPESVLNHLSDGRTQGVDIVGALNSIKQGNPASDDAGNLLGKLGF